MDEAHERSLNIDFILGYLARLLPQRPDLKVIITSATIDSERFAEHFGRELTGDRGQPFTVPAPVIEVSGRTYPVEVRYRPLAPDDVEPDTDDASGTSADASSEIRPGPAAPGELSEAELEALTSPDPAVRAAARARREAIRSGAGSTALSPRNQGARGKGRGRAGSTGMGTGSSSGAGEPKDQVTGILDAVDELLGEPSGDILVFLAGERDIRDTEAALIDHLGARYTPDGRSRTPGAIEVVPLYSRLSAAEQHRVFETHQTRRIVLATNVAETSLTVPGIRYVIDPGLARISRYSNRTKVQRLPIPPGPLRPAAAHGDRRDRAGRHYVRPVRRGPRPGSTRTAPDGDRAATGPPAHRPSPGSHAPGGRKTGLRRGGHGHCGGPVHPGRPRAPGGQARGLRRAAPALRRPDE